ncbi:MAG: TonB-dependent receptor [Acidobacteriota bacterium]
MFEELPVVEAATLHTQTLEEAPASVSVITREDIRKYGYRTLGDALAATRGFYLTDDRIYQYAGVRGFGLPGDFNVRFLVMLNGHYLTENIYSSTGWFGQDFGLDMDLVKRIEIIRGPSSALYGSNGIFATINIVTESPVDHPPARLSTELGNFGERKAQVSSSLNLGRGANLLFSASVFNNRGRDLYVPELDRETSSGWAHNADAERGYHTFANLIWRNWSVTALFNLREKQFPIPWGEGIFADPAQKSWDARNFVEAAWSRDVGSSGKLRWRLYYDQYRWRGRTHLELDDGGVEDNRDLGYGDWVGSQVTYRRPVPRLGTLTVGGEINADVRALQRNFSVAPEPVEYLNINEPDTSYGIFAQQERQLSRRWKAYLGLRFDDSLDHRRSVTPRVALIHQRSRDTVFKFLYGRAFRNPSAFEQFYDDHGLSALANPLLKPETADTFEIAVERRINGRLSAVTTAYHYRLADLIQSVRAESDLLQYQNVARNRAAGLEFELNGRPWWRFATVASLAWQKTINSRTRDPLPNSPAWIAKWRLAAPVRTNRLHLSGGLQYLSARRTLGGAQLSPACLLDVTATTSRLHPNFDLQFGVRNLADQRYYDPIALAHAVDRIESGRRTAFVKLIWHISTDPQPESSQKRAAPPAAGLY